MRCADVPRPRKLAFGDAVLWDGLGWCGEMPHGKRLNKWQAVAMSQWIAARVSLYSRRIICSTALW